MSWIRRQREEHAMRLAERAYQCLPVNIPGPERAPYIRRLTRIAMIQLACNRKRHAKRTAREIEKLIAGEEELGNMPGFGITAPELMQLARRMRNWEIAERVAAAEIPKQAMRRMALSLLSDDLQKCKDAESLDKALEEADQVIQKAPGTEQAELRSLLHEQLVQSCCESPKVRNWLRERHGQSTSAEKSPEAHQFRIQALLNFPGPANPEGRENGKSGAGIYRHADLLIRKAGEVRSGIPAAYLEEVHRMQQNGPDSQESENSKNQ